MVWLKYLKENGHVEEITEIEPVVDELVYGKVEANDYSVGDEFTYYIVVNIGIDNSFTTSSIRQAPSATYVLQQLIDISNRLATLEQFITTL